MTDEVRKAVGEQFTFGDVRDLTLKGLSTTYPAAPLDWSI